MAAPTGGKLIVSTGVGYGTAESSGDGAVILTGGNWSVKKHNFAATVAPTANDDTGDGYAVGSWWFDTTGVAAWVCLDPTAAAAVWIPLSYALLEFDDLLYTDFDLDPTQFSGSGPEGGTFTWSLLSPYPKSTSTTTAPAVTDDSGDGYAVGSRWVNTTTDKEYVATDVSVGAAVWKETTNVAGGGQLNLTLHAAQSTLTNLPAALTELLATTRFRVRADLTGFTEARLSVGASAAGPTGAKMRAQYSTDESAWSYLDDGTAPSVPLDAIDTAVSSWITLATNAKADVYLRIVTIDGTGTTPNGQVGTIALQFR